jgi:hypothetical protein
VGVGYKWKALTFDISAVGTNVTHSNAAAAAAGLDCGEGENACFANGANSFYRVSKLVPVASITASF